jgi:hypothetical protein
MFGKNTCGKIKMIEAKVCGTFMSLFGILKSRLSANIKLTFHKALIRSVVAYACSAWEFAADIHILRKESLQNNVLRTNCNVQRRTTTRELHVAIEILYVHELITKLSRQQAEVMPNRDKQIIRK